MGGWLIHSNRWGSIKKHIKIIVVLMKLVNRKITKNWQEKWMKKLILAKRKDFSQEYLADDQ
jgi:hypothetical protein